MHPVQGAQGAIHLVSRGRCGRHNDTFCGAVHYWASFHYLCCSYWKLWGISCLSDLPPEQSLRSVRYDESLGEKTNSKSYQAAQQGSFYNVIAIER